MKSFPTLILLCMLWQGAEASAPNYISKLPLELRGDFLQVKSSTYYRVSQVARVEALVKLVTNFDDGEPMVETYPLDKQVLLIAKSFRAGVVRAGGRTQARVEFTINGDSYLISEINEKHFQDQLYFERAIAASMEHFDFLLEKLQTKNGSSGNRNGDKIENRN